MATRKKTKPGQEFYFCTGARARTIRELRTAIASLTSEQFASHLSETKNDFYNWIKDCISPTLAERIKDVRDQMELVELLK